MKLKNYIWNVMLKRNRERNEHIVAAAYNLGKQVAVARNSAIRESLRKEFHALKTDNKGARPLLRKAYRNGLLGK